MISSLNGFQVTPRQATMQWRQNLSLPKTSLR